jgi:hypothetical protein
MTRNPQRLWRSVRAPNLHLLGFGFVEQPETALDHPLDHQIADIDHGTNARFGGLRAQKLRFLLIQAR